MGALETFLGTGSAIVGDLFPASTPRRGIDEEGFACPQVWFP